MAYAFPQLDYNEEMVTDFGFFTVYPADDAVINFILLSGYSVVTFGFLFDCQEIWANAEDSVTTTWTEETSGLFGSCVF